MLFQSLEPDSAGADDLQGEDGDDTLNGGPGVDTLRGGQGDDDIQRNGVGQDGDQDADKIFLEDTGSIDLISGNAGAPTLDLSGKAVPLTIFIKNNRAIIGFGAQAVDTAQILATPFTFTNSATLRNQFGNGSEAFEHLIGVLNLDNIASLIGGRRPIPSTSSRPTRL